MAAADWGEIWPIESGVGGACGVSGGICTYRDRERSWFGLHRVLLSESSPILHSSLPHTLPVAQAYTHHTFPCGTGWQPYTSLPQWQPYTSLPHTFPCGTGWQPYTSLPHTFPCGTGWQPYTSLPHTFPCGTSWQPTLITTTHLSLWHRLATLHITTTHLSLWHRLATLRLLWLLGLLLLPSNGLCLYGLLLVLAAFVLEPDTNHPWTQARQFHEVLLQQSVWSGVAGIYRPQRLQLLL